MRTSMASSKLPPAGTNCGASCTWSTSVSKSGAAAVTRCAPDDTAVAASTFTRGSSGRRIVRLPGGRSIATLNR